MDPETTLELATFEDLLEALEARADVAGFVLGVEHVVPPGLGGDKATHLYHTDVYFVATPCQVEGLISELVRAHRKGDLFTNKVEENYENQSESS